MKTTIDFSGVTAPRSPQRYATPVPPERSGRLLWSGASTLGSHAVRQMAGCLRAYAIEHPKFTMAGFTPHPSGRTGVVSMFPSPEAGVVEGPVSPVDAEGARGSTVYMLRGSLAHIILGHALIEGTLARGESIYVCGRLYEGSGAGLPWYTPPEALETAAVLVGTPAFTFALPAARMLLPRLTAWAKELLTDNRILGVETELAWDLDAPWLYTVRYDVLVQNRASGLVRGIDYKTSAQPKKDKLRYATATQLVAQDVVGLTWAGARWGGVQVLLIEDKGDGTVSAAEPLELWPLPRSPRIGDVGSAISAVFARVLPYVGQADRKWPVNPLHCSTCSATTQRKCFTM